MLLGPDVAEFAQATLTGLMHLSQHVEHFLAAAGEFAVAFALLEHLQGIGVFFLLNEPATAVTTVVVDVERFVARRSGREFGHVDIGAIGVGIMVARRTVKVADDLFAGIGGIQGQTGRYRYYK